MCRSHSNRNESKVKMTELCFPFGLALQPFDLSSRWAIIRPICRQIDCVSTEDIGFVLSPSRSSQSSHRSSTKRLLSALALASILMFGLPNCSIANHSDWLLAIQVTCFLFLPIHAAAAAAEPPTTTASIYCCCCCCLCLCCVFVFVFAACDCSSTKNKNKQQQQEQNARLSPCKSRVLIVCVFWQRDTTWHKLIMLWQRKALIRLSAGLQSSFLLGEAEGQLTKRNWKNPVEEAQHWKVDFPFDHSLLFFLWICQGFELFQFVVVVTVDYYLLTITILN